MASKNNPRNRENLKLVVKCPETGEEMKIVRRVPGGMFYKSEATGKYYKMSKGSYKQFEHEWRKK